MDEVLDQGAVVEMTASVEEDSDVVPETEETPVQAAGGTVDRAVSGVAEEVDSADEYSGISSVFREPWTRVTRSAMPSSRRERAERQRERSRSNQREEEESGGDGLRGEQTPLRGLQQMDKDHGRPKQVRHGENKLRLKKGQKGP